MQLVKPNFMTSPMVLVEEKGSSRTQILAGNILIAEFFCWYTDKNVINPKFIIQACNSYSSLLVALRRTSTQSVGCDWSANQALLYASRHARVDLEAIINGKNQPSECHFAGGISAYCEGHPRKLPTYFTQKTGKNPKSWLNGWDQAKKLDVLPTAAPEYGHQPSAETPIPWRVVKGGTSYYPIGVSSSEEGVIDFHSWDHEKEEKAAFITKACNAYGKLVDLLRKVASQDVNDDSANVLEALKQEIRVTLRSLDDQPIDQPVLEFA